MNKISLYSNNYQDQWFNKDGAQLLLNLKKYNFEPQIITFNYNSDYKVTEESIPVVKLNPKKLYWGNLTLLNHLFFNAKNIDILMTFHISFGSLIALYFYKVINRKGVAYLKMDNNHNAIKYYEWERIWTEKNKNLTFKQKLMKIFINKIDVFTIEDDLSKKYYESKYTFLKGKLSILYNCYSTHIDRFNINSWEKKKNHFISAARFGTYEKATDILLEAFALSKTKQTWKLILCGSIDSHFSNFIEEYFIKHPDLKNRIEFKGVLNQEELFKEYNKSKIFLLPSRSEGFPNVISEAMRFGNALITSNKVALHYKYNNFCGYAIEPNDAEILSHVMISLANDNKTLLDFQKNALHFATNNFNWDGNLIPLIDKFNTLIQKKKKL